MKRFTVLLLVLVMLFSLAVAGCGGNNGEEPAGEESKKESTEGEEKEVAFPEKPVEITVLFGAGGGQDLIVRKIAEIAEEKLGQPIVVVNRTGAGGAVGYTHVKEQKPDGYSVVASSSSISTAYHKGNMDFDYRTFKGVCLVVKEPVSITVKADAPWQTLDELFEYAKENPGKVRIGNSGIGTFTHLSAAAMANHYGADVVHVPFGKGLAIASLLGDKIEASVQLLAEAMNQVEAGSIRVLAVTGDERLEAVPDVPTLKEIGFEKDLVLWRGFHVPKGTPDEVVNILAEAFKYAIETDEFKEFAKGLGAEISYLGPKEFDEFVAENDTYTAEIMESIGLKK